MNRLEILRQFFRKDPEGIANRRKMIEMLRNHWDAFARELAGSEVPKPEEEIPDETLPSGREADTRKKRLRQAYRLTEALAKPVSMRENEE